MKRFRRILIIIVVLIIVGLILSNVFKKPSGPAYTTAKVQKTDLVQTVDATGSISSAEEIGMNFKATGRVSSLKVAVGDQVTQGQMLAQLSAANLESEVSRSQASVRSAEADLEKLLTGISPEERAVSEEEVSNANIQLDLAKTKLQNLTVAQEKTRADYIATSIQTLVDKKFASQYALNVMYDTLLDQDATDLFKTTKTVSWQTARDEYNLAHNDLPSIEALITTAQASQNASDALKALYALQANLNEVTDSLQDGLDALSGGIVNSSYSAATIEAMKADVNAQASAISTAKVSAQASISNLTTGEQDLQRAFDEANFAVKTADGALQLAKAKLNLSVAKPQDYEIKQQQAKVAQAQASLQAALSNLSDTVITAPLAGTITAVDIKVGEQSSVTKAAITMIGTGKLEIHVDIPESDITKVAVSDAVTVTLDAFGPDTKFTGIVQSIEPAERLIEGVVYYRLTINLSDESQSVKPGMTANITITTATKTGVLAIPARAVVNDTDGKKKVKVLAASSNVQEREVTTGLKGDGGMIEVTSGLQEGEDVVTGEQKK